MAQSEGMYFLKRASRAAQNVVRGRSLPTPAVKCLFQGHNRMARVGYIFLILCHIGHIILILCVLLLQLDYKLQAEKQKTKGIIKQIKNHGIDKV